MLVKVEVRTRQGTLLSLPLGDDSSGFRVSEIEGLDPVKATLVSSGFAGLDGEQYQSSRRETRNIKIQLELDPDPTTDTVRSLRSRLYNFFMPKSEVSLRFFMEDGLEVDIVGIVETCETAMFTAEPAVDISIICFDPDFIDPTLVQQTGMTTADTLPRDIDYDGTVNTGIKFVLLVDRSVSQFTIYHTTPSDEVKTLDFSASLISGDWLLIDTIPGEKQATLIRSGVTSSVLYAISPQSTWIELEPGLNKIKVEATGTGIPLTVEHYNRYGGL